MQGGGGHPDSSSEEGEGAEDEGILNGQPAGRWALPGSPLPSAGVAWPPAGTRMDQCVVTAASSLASSSL